MKTVVITGVKIGAFRHKKELYDLINDFLTDGHPHFIVTANPEILLAARHDEEYYYVLSQADLIVPDGFGLKIAGCLAGTCPARIVGADLTVDLLQIAARRNYKVAVIIWRGGLSPIEDIKKVCQEKFNGVRLYVNEVERGLDSYDAGLIQFQPDILLVGLGAPWQEKLIFHNLSELPSIKLAMGVGGTFDFLTGKIKRAPSWLRNIGLEWLWRLRQQPWRWPRIIRATIIFPLVFVKQHFLNRFFYRQNVVALLVNGAHQALILNWAKDTDYWGLPQGGVDFGETRKEAMARELEEEIGTDKFEIVAEYKNIYTFFWPRDYFHFGYKGQKQTLFLVEFSGQDDDIKLKYWDHKDWRWVELENLISESHPVHKEAYTIFLEKYKSFK